MKTRIIPLAVLCAAAVCCAPKALPDWTEEESMLIWDCEGVMPVLTVQDSLELNVLRAEAAELSDTDILSDTYSRLASLMVATVTSPEQDGVGIAGPQVGVSRRVVAVQRFDKEGEPFEVYPGIRITALRGETVEGPEGCLSIPGLRGMVPRYRDIDITYKIVRDGAVRDTTERVEGFTAVIFQHETDHLDGVLYTDRAVAVSPR